jgi:hypothetical protein
LTPAAAKAAMAAGVKTAAIVNYEKYVTHPAPATLPKKDEKPKSKPPAKAAAHHARARKAPVKSPKALFKAASGHQAQAKPAPVIQTALKTKEPTTPGAAKKSAVAHPVASPPPVAATAVQKKPSAGIPRESPHN